jgi:predicted DNA-binding protein
MIRYSLRLPDELHERIKRLAERDNRSLNGQLITMLEAETKRLEKKK